MLGCNGKVKNEFWIMCHRYTKIKKYKKQKNKTHNQS